MAEKYLFVAEADKIQNMLFRFSRQRQVLGGSRLLALLGDEVEKLAKKYDSEVLISRGGNFRVVFTNENAISDFGEQLALFYRLLLDSGLTIAGYAAYDEAVENSFDTINKKLQRKLRCLKSAERGVIDEAHAPIIAFCQNSGSGLADNIGELLYGENEHNYLSKAAQEMGHAGGLGRYSQDEQEKKSPSGRAKQKTEETKAMNKADSDDHFLSEIRDKIDDDNLKKNGVWPREVDEIGKLDPRHNNVAYLLADANGMGKLFDECQSPNELMSLSTLLDEALRKAVASPIPQLYQRLEERIKKTWHRTKDMDETKMLPSLLPLLPLILAGDDAFILLPACYALDYVKRFCLKFQKYMKDELDKSFPNLVKKFKNRSLSYPTISAAVVFCKTKYPYHLAHQRGAKLLDTAKTFTKTYTDNGEQFPSLAFEIVIGNQLVKPSAPDDSKLEPTMNPYWISAPPNAPLQKRSVALETLLACRLNLKNIKGKRLAELREFFTPEILPRDNQSATSQPWQNKIQKWIERLEIVYSEKTWVKNLQQALLDLGEGAKRSGEIAPWRTTGRSDDKKRHGMLDLIEAWNYAQNLDKQLSDYEEDENE